MIRLALGRETPLQLSWESDSGGGRGGLMHCRQILYQLGFFTTREALRSEADLIGVICVSEK